LRLSRLAHGLALLGAVIALVAPSRDARAACTPPDCALDLGSSGAYVTLGNTSALGLPAFTLEAWFQRQGTGASASTGTGGVTAIPLVAKGRGEADGNNRDMNWFLGIRASDGVLVADFEEDASGPSPGLNHPIAGATPIASGVWYHAAASYDGTTWRLYLNGVLDATSTIGRPVRSDSIQHAALGSALSSTGAASGAFDGVLDEVRVWNVARSGAEIAASLGLEITTHPNLVARYGLNEGSGVAVGDSSGTAQNGILSGTGATWAPEAPFEVNAAPDPPTLVAPPDASASELRPPTLAVEVSDPDSDPLTVRFFGRVAAPAADDFAIIALPDTQFYSSGLNGGSPAIFAAQTQWIVDQRASRDIAYVAQLGDCVQNGNNGGNDSEWLAADAAISLLENPLTTLLTHGVPYGISVGNHDQSPFGEPVGSPPENSTTSYNEFFGESRFLGRSYYGGHYGANNDNHYQLFSAGGMDFIAISFEYDTSPDPAVLSWADALLKTHASRRAIAHSHHIVNTGNPGSFGAQGQAIYDALKNNPNLFLMLSGHVCNGSPPNIQPEGLRQDTFEGRVVTSMLSDYQCDTAGGNGWLRILTFRPQENEIRVETYSPWLGQYRTGSLSQFTVPYDMSDVGFTQIAEIPNAASGSIASAPWPDLEITTTYEWYASISDGDGATISGPVWSFTTSAAEVCGDGAVAATEACDDGDVEAGDGCSPTCQIETCFACSGQPSACAPTSGAACDDGVFCNGVDVCSSGVCTHAGDPCAGGSECADACDELVDVCADVAGTPCGGDGSVCTDDVCDGAGVCGVANVSSCDDGDACTVTDMCSAGSCSPGTAINACAHGDGCCPDGCAAEADDDCSPPPAPVPLLGRSATFALVAALALGSSACLLRRRRGSRG
jgi:cysteine-rich repeat protein